MIVILLQLHIKSSSNLGNNCNRNLACKGNNKNTSKLNRLNKLNVNSANINTSDFCGLKVDNLIVHIHSKTVSFGFSAFPVCNCQFFSVKVCVLHLCFLSFFLSKKAVQIFHI